MEQHKAWLNAICDGGYQVSTHEITVELWGMAGLEGCAGGEWVLPSDLRTSGPSEWSWAAKGGPLIMLPAWDTSQT